MSDQQPKRPLARVNNTALALLTAPTESKGGAPYSSSLDSQRGTPRRRRAVLSLLLASLLIVTGGVRPFATRAATPAPPAGYLFGVLNDRHPERAAQDYGAGIRVVEMDLGWNVYEPQDGVFSDVTQQGSFAYTTKQALQAYKAAGLKVILGLNLQYAPAWVYSYPNSHYVDQFGGQAPQVNLTFNETLRQKAEAYIARVNQDLGFNNFYAIRAGGSINGELYYPYENAGGHGNGFWAFDANAHGAGDLPSSIPANPFPGWQPGQTTYNGQPFSTAQVGQWMGWYIGALVDGANWQIRTYRNLGFTGQVQVPIPGWGQRPNDYDCAVQHYLDGTCDATILQQMGQGTAWNRVIDKLSDPGHNLAIDISSVDDSTSQAYNGTANLCQSGDDGVNINDPQITTWSATRWIAYNARRVGYSMTGENPAQDSVTSTNPYGAQMMHDAAVLMQSCGLGGLLWAFEDNLYNGSSDGTLSAYSNVIAQYPQDRGVVVTAPFSLASPSVVQGGSLTASATLQNTGGASVMLPQIALAGRPPGSTNTTGTHADFGSLYNVTLAPGQSVTIQQTRQFSTSDPTGQWYGYLTYETADGVWHDDTHNVFFAVTAPAAAATATATLRPTSTPIPPTATSTPIPPTATRATATLRPTNTPIPPTATATRAPMFPAVATPQGTPSFTITKAAVMVRTSVGYAPAVNVAPGATLSLTATLTTNRSLPDSIVDLYVYDASWRLVTQLYSHSGALTAGIPSTATRSWTVPAGTPAGTYQIMIGVYGPSWTPQYLWASRVATFAVGATGGLAAPLRTNVRASHLSRPQAHKRMSHGRAKAISE